MKKSLDVAVIGCGYWGPNLIRNFDALPGVTVRMICDADPSRLERVAAQYPRAEKVMSSDDVFGDSRIDAVVVATPVSTHYDLARRALASGKHVFVEKPMTSSVAEARELIQLARERNLTLMVGHVFVYTAAVRKIKEIISSGELGQVFYMSSQRLNLGLCQRDINVTWDLAPHDISIILYLLDEMPQSVSCQGKAHVHPNVEDITVMTMSFRNQAFATVQSSWLDPSKTRKATIVGSRKMIVYDDLEPLEKIKIYDKRVEVPPHYDSFEAFPFSYHYGGMTAPHIQQEEPLRVECQRFVDCIVSGDVSDSDGVHGLQVVKLLEAASRSLRSGGAEVAIEHDPEDEAIPLETAAGKSA